MSNIDVYIPCLCGSGKKFKFCCYQMFKKNEMVLQPDAISKFPIYTCKVIKNWKNTGISPVYVVRELIKDSYIFISYLVDFWCLGLKDVNVKMGITASELDFLFGRNEYELATIPYQDARSLVLGAIDYARSLDIPPGSAWKGIVSSFIEADQPYTEKFSFGKNGVPFYSSGPYDSEKYDVREIIDKVQKANGDYVINIG